MTIAEIQELVCQAYGVQRLDMLSRRRGRGIMQPRHVAMWLARDATPHTMAVIARHFADRDPTTILYAVTQIDVRRRTDQAFAQRLEGLRQTIERSGPIAEPTEQERKTPRAATYALASAKAYLARQIAEAKAEMRAVA